jgi:lipid-A-disaccharide synthase
MVDSICIIVGEPSGDLYASKIISELLSKKPNLNIFGVGGDNMIKSGLRPLFHINQLSFMGIVEVIKNLPVVKKVLNIIEKEVKLVRPDVLVLVDFPGFNLKLVERVKKYCKKVIYFISPQLWAWGEGRVKKIRKFVDEMLVIFPFEKDFYFKNNINSIFVGHPLIEIINENSYISQEDFFMMNRFELSKKLIAVFPGSRYQEIKKHMPILEEVIAEFSSICGYNVGVAISPTIDIEIFKKFRNLKNVSLITENRYNLLKHSDFAVIKSGTSTIETAIFGIPMVVFYKTSWLNYNLGKYLVNVESFGMVNIIAGKKIVPELLQNEVTATNIINETEKFLSDKEKYDSIKKELLFVKEKLGNCATTKLVSEIILNAY